MIVVVFLLALVAAGIALYALYIAKKVRDSYGSGVISYIQTEIEDMSQQLHCLESRFEDEKKLNEHCHGVLSMEIKNSHNIK